MNGTSDPNLPDDAAPDVGRPPARWLSWLLGAAMLGAVVVVAMRLAEAQDFLRIAERAEPWWLLAAVALQAATYLAEAQVWRSVAHAVDFPLPVRFAYGLSLTKLFVDQALPSGGISGTVVVARALSERGMPRPAVMAAVVVDTASHYSSYVGCLAAATCISFLHRQTNALVAVATLAFALFAVGVAVSVLTLSGKGLGRATSRFARLRPLRAALRFLEDADPALARRPRLLLVGVVCRGGIFLLDAATMWVLIRALGTDASPPSVFASFMTATLFRTVGVLPGGLGTFEATSVLTLRMVGVDVAVALSATLLFRGLSFWLPMLPGMWLSHALAARRRRDEPVPGPP